MKERYNTLKVFKQRKQLIWNLKFHADTATIFSQMNKTLNLQYHGIFCITYTSVKNANIFLNKQTQTVCKIFEC